MDYVIIKDKDKNLLEIIKLTDWESWEWCDFSTVKYRVGHGIVWFEYEREAIRFMFDNFPRESINPKYEKEKELVSFSGLYYVD